MLRVKSVEVVAGIDLGGFFACAFCLCFLPALFNLLFLTCMAGLLKFSRDEIPPRHRLITIRPVSRLVFDDFRNTLAEIQQDAENKPRFSPAA